MFLYVFFICLGCGWYRGDLDWVFVLGELMGSFGK